jgi:hypothetical protein
MNWSSLAGRAANGLESVMMKGNHAISPVASSAISEGKQVYRRAASVSRSLAKDMKTSGFAMKAAAGGIVGGGAGYATSDKGNETSGSIKGAALGILGAGAWQAGTNRRLQSTLRSGSRSIMNEARAGVNKAEGAVRGAALDSRLARGPATQRDTIMNARRNGTGYWNGNKNWWG